MMIYCLKFFYASKKLLTQQLSAGSAYGYTKIPFRWRSSLETEGLSEILDQFVCLSFSKRSDLQDDVISQLGLTRKQL